MYAWRGWSGELRVGVGFFIASIAPMCGESTEEFARPACGKGLSRAGRHGLGFLALVNRGFDATRKIVEKALGKPLKRTTRR